MSVVTFVGQASNTAPVLSSVSNQVINAGVALTITNRAFDPDAPPQMLTFNLVQAPTSATMNASNGVFVWRPAVAQANTTNLVAIRVTDNGSPSLSATNTFTITVPSLSRPVISSISSSSGRLTLTISGTVGPDYTLLTSTNLLNWQTLLTTNPAALPMTLVLTNDYGPQRFYRVQLGP
jgi:hypothetical protein